MIHIFLGTKAQLIKMAPIMKTLQDKRVNYNFVFSGQHQETMYELRKNFGIKAPDIVLHKGKDIVSIPKMLIWSLKLICFTIFNKKKVWKGDKNGIVLNHGDTFSTLLGSILSKVSGLKCAHIESGLRSYNILHPFPEELTRLVVFRLSDYFFAPGEWALKNLESFKGIKIDTRANTLFDSLCLIRSLRASSDIDIPSDDYGVVSLHRFENIFHEKQLEKIIELLVVISDRVPLIFIMHRPTKKRLVKTGLIKKMQSNNRINIRPRYDYLNFIELVKKARFVITDGGSNQEECYYLGKPCLLFRNATERKEGIGENAVLSCFDKKIIDEFIRDIDRYEKKEVPVKYRPTDIIIDELSLFMK